MTLSQTSGAAPTRKLEAHDPIALVRDFVRELHRHRAGGIEVSPRSRLDRDLGIDSLGRTELILRLEHAFGVRLPAATVAEVETVRDLLQALERAAPAQRLAPAERTAPASLPLVAAPTEARTLTEVLDWHVAQHGDRMHVTVLADEQTVLESMTYGQLAKAARRVAEGLITREVVPGDRVALMLPTGNDFFAAFYGVLYAGAVPVPIYPPARLTQLEEHMRRQAGILRNAGTRILVTVPEAVRLASLLQGQVEDLSAIESVASLSAAAQGMPLPPVEDGQATAFIQYTSGSTGDPKGVVLSHANLLANIRAIGQVLDANSADVFVSWLPLYHDLGLIGGWLGSLYFAASFYVMSPLTFLLRPESWLWAMHRFRATLSASPNFGFELCASKVDAADLEGLDLSSLRMVANGAEPVSVQTLRRFIARFERYDFKAEAMAPAYGLAENTVGLTFPPLGRAPLIDRVEREALSRRGAAERAKADDPRALEIVSCGQPLPGHEVRIVDELGHELGERREGRLEFRGPSATSGYFRNEVKTRELFHDGWLDSGDQAYVAAGEVYVTGRIKDIIIRAGRHIYPQEIEEAVGEIEGVVPNGVAAFGMVDQASGTERTVVMLETAESDPAARRLLQARARDVTTDILGAPAEEIVLAPPQAVPKTASGKIRRGAAKDLYEAGTIGAPRRTIRLQLLRLFLAGIGARWSRLPRLAGAVLYAAWWWLVVASAAFLCWLAVLLLPRLAWRWGTVRGLARAALALIGARLSVTGAEHLPAASAVLVFNHASYADALAVAASVPDSPLFVAKRELDRQAFAGPFLRRLGALFVERYDVAGSLADAKVVIAAGRSGRPLVFFPEGTFSRRAGLTDFYLGAFKVAAEAGLPVVPAAIRGTRSMLRADQWFPRRAAISVHFVEPIDPAGADFASVLALRDRARQAVLRHCGEPDLGGLAKPERTQA